MTIIETIVTAYPELQDADLFSFGVVLQDDSDGQGTFIAAWDYSKPIPDGLKLGK
jgi:hypothetical protein